MHSDFKYLLQGGGLVRDNFFDFQFVGTMNRFVAFDATISTHFPRSPFLDRFRVWSGRALLSGVTGRSRIGQCFEHSVCPLPRRVEVAAIQRDQRARSFENRVGLL
jgi:hypothetical protein